MTIRFTLLFLISSCYISTAQALLSHNDYAQSVPLHNAMKGNFNIIEADIYLRDSIIVVCHDTNEISDAPTLGKLYIAPLKKYTPEQLKGKILLLDLKEYSPLLLKCINKMRTNNSDLFKHMSILITGEFDRDLLSKSKDGKELLLDGRLSNIDSNISKEHMPIISIKITDLIRWNGYRKIRRQEALKLKSIIDRVHLSGRKIRFWNVKDDYQAWNVLRALEVDIIGVDDIEKYYKYKTICH